MAPDQLISLEPPREIGGALSLLCNTSHQQALARLVASERDFASRLTPPRARAWGLGRACLREALASIGVDAPAMLGANDRGAPVVPNGVVASLSHKRELAVAWAQRVASRPGVAWHLGVDLETLEPPRQPIEARVLTPLEISLLPEEPRARVIRLKTVFAVKEAAYKAIDPFARRHIGFGEAVATQGSDGIWVVEVASLPAFAMRARTQLLDGHVIATAWAFPLQ